MPEIPEDPMMNMLPNALIYGARYDKVMEDFGGKGFFVEDPKDIGSARQGDGVRMARLLLILCSPKGLRGNCSSLRGTPN